MSKIKNVDEWQLDKKIPDAKRYLDVSIIFKYPDQRQFVTLKPKDRIKAITLDQKGSLKKLLSLSLFGEFEVIGTKKRPRGVKAKIKFTNLPKLEKLDFIESILIESVDYATKLEVAETENDKYYCVKITVVIEIEGITPKKQDIEERFVLIKANSFDDAYEKLENQKDDYAEPYLNSDGRFVSWRIDSFDDCYITDIISPDDLNRPEGVEVYSKLSSRKANKK